jgi:Na+-transporting methylmalonyl-CoA/oxaloacetate decarboxylase gamma subunit
MSEINVKQIRKAAELLGMKPKDLIHDFDIKLDQKIITAEIKSDFEEKVDIFIHNYKFTDLRKLIYDFDNPVPFWKSPIFYLVIVLLACISLFFFINCNVVVDYFKSNFWMSGEIIIIFFLSILIIAILFFGLMLCKIIYEDITAEKKSPQRYAVEELVKIIEIIDKQEKY